MALFKIGVLTDWFGLGLHEGIRESQRVGAEGVQMYAVDELHPDTITSEGIEEVKRLAADCGQTITALCGELGGHGFAEEAENAAKIIYMKKALDLAKKLGTDVVTTHIGVIPQDKSHPRYAVMLAACRAVGQYAQSLGASVAIETGPETIATLCEFIHDCGGGISINYDPANLAGSRRDDEVQGVYTGAEFIVHTHAKDSHHLKAADAETQFEVFAKGGIEASHALRTSEEMPLGQGDVRWPAYLAALKDIGYTGHLTIEREIKGPATRDDIAHGVRFLRQMMAELEG